MEKSDILVSIIMAAYNAEKTVGTAIDSVLRQTYQNFELIVVNDCSRDRTRKIVESYMNSDDRIFLINNEKNGGVSYSRHAGFLQSKGSYIAILDSDDYWAEGKLEAQIEVVKDVGAQLIFTGVSYIDENNVKKQWKMHVPSSVDFKALLKQNVITNSSALVDARLYAANESMGDQMHEDYACWLRILRGGTKAIGIDAPLLVYRVSSRSKSGNKIKSGLMIWRTYRYIGLGIFCSFFYLCCYMVNGTKKYRSIMRS